MSYVSPQKLGEFFSLLKKNYLDKKVEKENIVNNDTTTANGYVADARIVKTHGDEIDTVNGQLAVNSQKFYFDYHDGEYGYNTSPLRGADTFTPFKKTTVIDLGEGTTFNVSYLYRDYASLTASNFVVEPANASGSKGNDYHNTGQYQTIVYYSFTLTKTYSTSTGILTSYGTANGRASALSGGVSGSAKANVHAYLIV